MLLYRANLPPPDPFRPSLVRKACGCLPNGSSGKPFLPAVQAIPALAIVEFAGSLWGAQHHVGCPRSSPRFDRPKYRGTIPTRTTVPCAHSKVPETLEKFSYSPHEQCRGKIPVLPCRADHSNSQWFPLCHESFDHWRDEIAVLTSAPGS